MQSKQFILSGLFLMLLFLIMYISLFFYQLEAPVKAEYWIQHSYVYKDYKAKSIKGKKIIVISGSNSIFGINSKILEDKINYPVVNLAVHANLNMDFLYYKLQKNISHGDIVVMPLELRTYEHPDKTSKWFFSNIMAWDKNYLNHLPFMDFLKFIVNVEPSRVFRGSIVQFESNSSNSKILFQKEILSTLHTLWQGEEGVKWRGYNYKSLNQFGDISADKAVEYNQNASYLDKEPFPTQYFLNRYNKIATLVKENNGTLFLTYPVTIKNLKFDLATEKSQKKIEYLKHMLKINNINIYCNAALFNLDRVYFFNSLYHPNKYGALINSENIADCLKSLLDKGTYEISYKEAISKVAKLENRYIDLVKKSNYDIRLNDFKNITKALAIYHKENGFYPKSEGYDGLYSNYGKSGEDWIKGLVPKYIKSLPRDPRKTNSGNMQYLYKSNGKDYKLFVTLPEDCKKVEIINPKIIDPIRGCRAYGYWTSGGRRW